jgi:hypothetical protein
MKLFWKSYSILFLFITAGNFLYFINPHSAFQFYYFTLMTLDPSYYIAFFLNALNITLTLASAFIGLFYAFNVRLNFLVLVEYLLWGRFLSDIAGHHYEIKFIQSAFVQDRHFGLVAIASIVIPLIPSYIAHYRYSKQK